MLFYDWEIICVYLLGCIYICFVNYVRGDKLETLERIITIASNSIMLVIGIYTSYLTLFCKKIELIGYKFKHFCSDKDLHYSVELDIYNPSLSPKCIYGLYLVYNKNFVISIKDFKFPLMIEPRTVLHISGADWWNPDFDMGRKEVQEEPIYLLACTNKGWTVSCYHELRFLKAFKAHIQGQKLRYRMFRNKLHRIIYVLKDENGEILGSSSSNLIEETFIIQEYWGINKLDR